MEGISGAKIYLGEISPILKSAFGPNGKDVLLKSDTGVTYLTRNGYMIVQQLEVKHPIAKLIKNAVQNYSNMVGDFTKIYMIMLNSLLDSLARKFCLETGTLRAENIIPKRLSSISMSLLALCSRMQHKTVQDYIASIGFLTQVSSKKFFENYFDGLFNVVCCGKFNVENMSVTKKILTDIFHYVPLSKRNLCYIIDNFDSICIEVDNVPFTQSKFVEGIIIQREPKPDGVIHNSLCRFIVITGNINDSSAGVELSLNGETDLSKQQILSVKFYEKLVKMLVDNNVSLIFCEEKVPSVLCSLLESAKISYIPFVLNGDLEYICSVYNISPVSGLHDLFFIQNFEMIIGTASYFKSCILGTHISSHIGPPMSSQSSKPYQIIICSLYGGMKSQYINAILNVIKAIYNCFGSDDDYMYLIPSCGFFEMVITEMVKDMKTDENIISNEKSVTCEMNELNIDKDVEALFCQSMNNLINFLTLSKTSKNNLYDINAYSRIDKFWTSNDFTHLVNGNKVALYEPFYSKMKMLESVVAVCAQTSRIDHIIPVKQLNVASIDEEEET